MAQVSPLASWDAYAKLIIGAGVGLLTISGGLFGFAWSVAKKTRSEWIALATEHEKTDTFADRIVKIVGKWATTSDFTKAVNEARKPLVERMILEMHIEIDRRIATHNDRQEAHRPAIRHSVGGSESALMLAIKNLERELQRQIDENRQRLDKLEEWDGNDRRRGRKT